MFMEQNIKGFSIFAHLKVLFDKYELNVTEENRTELLNYLKAVHVGLPLPSGRYGSSLAVALEMQNYPSALLITKNATELNIDLENVSSELGGAEIMSAKECFDFSLSYFERELDEELYKNFPEHLEYIKRNIAASKDLQEIFELKTNQNKPTR